MAWEYSQKTTQLFLDAVAGKPGTHLGEIEDPDGLGEHGSIACGDALRFTFRVNKHATDPLQDVIIEAKYLTFGCTSAIASSEALCAIIEQGEYTPVTALKISNKDIIDFLEGLPDQKIHCSVMGAEALEAAVFNWAQKRNVDIAALGIDMHAEDREEGRLVCQCFTLSEPYVRRKVQELGLKTIPEITAAIKAGGACGSCHHAPGGLQDILDDIWGKTSSQLKTIRIEEKKIEDVTELSSYKFYKKIDTVVDEYIRPLLKKDGGDFEIIDIKEKLIYGRLKGACASCIGANQTLKMIVEKTIKDQVSPDLKVITV
ncbi:iron-sulfur cluster assembly scaffold protein [candidate division CSSED10-310 bacterium]|uniref:Nitrogen fixation protein NifU n=1 Tax=candidate division CSSED10-310 bacterium TaxID=2855610 RepID=A0ABV6Z5A9_UNCC1